MVSYFDPQPSNPKPLNGSQFSQGTLFQQPKPTDENRYPRGYTPERLRQTATVISPGKVRVSADVPSTKNSAFRPRSEYEPPLDRPSAVKYPYKVERSARDNQQAHARRSIVDMAARSTMPKEDMRDVGSYHITPLRPGRAGEYHSTHGSVKLSPAAFGDSEGKAYVRAAEQSVLVHEVGHSADNLKSGSAEWSRRGQDRGTVSAHPDASPSLEGAAEGYAFRHSRQRPGEPAVPYTKTMSYSEFHNEEGFKKTFQEASGGTSVRKAVTGSDEFGRGRRGWTPQPYQERLFMRAAPPERTGTELDHGQFELIADWKRQPGASREEAHAATEVGTIRSGAGVPSNVLRDGFESYDHMHVVGLKQHGVKKREHLSGQQWQTQERVRNTWNRYNPDDRIGS